MLIFAAIVGKKRKILNALISIALFAMITLIRLFALKSFVPEGTGGSKVSETFNLADFFLSMRIEILYLLGINTGPEHLNGINFHNVNTVLKLVIIIGILAAFAFIIKFIYSIILLFFSLLLPTALLKLRKRNGYSFCPRKKHRPLSPHVLFLKDTSQNHQNH